MVNHTKRHARATSPAALTALLLLPLLALLLASGCDKSKDDTGGADDTAAQLDAAVSAMAEALEKHHAEHGALPETGYLVYCRGGRSVIEDDELYAKQLGFTLPGDIKNIDLCLNVAEDGKKAGIHARAKPTDETGRCLMLDASAATLTRSEITDAASCSP